jgi:hypothetical protein
MAQHFFIRKGSELPVLKMKVTNDGRSEYKDIYEKLENATVTFSMRDVETGRYKVFNKAGLVIPWFDEACGEEKYYIGYKFTTKDTDRPGCYRAEFKIDFLDDGCTLIVPIYDELFVDVLDSQTNSKIVC